MGLGKKPLIGKKIIDEVEEKIKRLKLPKRFSIRPTLVHVNGVEDRVLDENYFDKIIDFSQLLNSFRKDQNESLFGQI